MKPLPLTLGILALLFSTGCRVSAKKNVMAAEAGDRGETYPTFSLAVYDADGDAIFEDQQNTTGAMSLRELTSYRFVVTPRNGSDGDVSYRLSIFRVDVLNPGDEIVLDLAPGNNDLEAPAAGDYAFRIAAIKEGKVYPPRTFQSSVVCDIPSDLSVNPAGIQIGGSDNVYSFTSPGASAISGGRGPYFCAFDVNGDGSHDQAFAPCGGTTTDYVNYVDMRRIGLLVKDSCNNLAVVTTARNLAFAPRTPGDGTNFIHGRVTYGTGSAEDHLAIFKGFDDSALGTNYWATNHGAGTSPLSVSFSPNGANSSFSIGASVHYRATSSQHFGMRINVGNLVTTHTLEEVTVDASQARLTSISYSTDAAGDARPAIQLTGGASGCSLYDHGVGLVSVVGHTYNFHFYGRYNCSGLAASDATADIAGEFDGSFSVQHQPPIPAPPADPPSDPPADPPAGPPSNPPTNPPPSNPPPLEF